MKILLVEPSYRNKYPPLGLMKIATYHNKRKDEVFFVKGEVKDLPYEIWDRVYITTLFTFYFDITIHTIRFYKRYVKKVSDIYVGGILASLMKDKIKEEAGIENVITGLLDNSSVLGLSDKICIDSLVPDYSILDHITYKYPATDCYISYTTRGCPNHCSFCAVPLLEPSFKTSGNIYKQIHLTDRFFGTRKNLLLLDNNILNTPNLSSIINALKKAGFLKKPTYIKKSPLDFFIQDFESGKCYRRQFARSIKYLEGKKSGIENQQRAELTNLLERIRKSKNPFRYLYNKADNVRTIIGSTLKQKPSQRYIDFNQGLDASLLSSEKLSLLAEIPIKPLRIAFDSIRDKDDYCKAVRLARMHGFKSISNYLLYNYTDRPEDLWKRININMKLRYELGISIFSFPMKYSPVNMIDRKYIGKHWNKKYLRAINDILLVKKGIVSSNKSFVEKAFGKDVDDFFRILSMPQDFIIYRMYFENNGMTALWNDLYSELCDDEKIELIKIISDGLNVSVNKKIRKILKLYEITYEEEIEQN